MEFIGFMLKARTLFDRYIIKSQGEDEEDEHLKWIMLKPYLFFYKKEKRSSLRYRNTFSEGYDEVEENEKENDIQKRIVMQESMLQVTFRTKKYKNWLFNLMEWLYEYQVNNVNPFLLSEFLDKWILNHYESLLEKTMPADNVLLYAKWKPVTHTVKFYLDRKTYENILSLIMPGGN